MARIRQNLWGRIIVRLFGSAGKEGKRMATGTVKRWNDQKGYGFIAVDGGTERRTSSFTSVRSRRRRRPLRRCAKASGWSSRSSTRPRARRRLTCGSLKERRSSGHRVRSEGL